MRPRRLQPNAIEPGCTRHRCSVPDCIETAGAAPCTPGRRIAETQSGRIPKRKRPPPGASVHQPGKRGIAAEFADTDQYQKGHKAHFEQAGQQAQRIANDRQPGQ